VSEKCKRKQGGKGRPWSKGVSGSPSGKVSRLTKMGEEFMREMFKPVDAQIGGKMVRARRSTSCSS
jgi:hypothetical protein